MDNLLSSISSPSGLSPLNCHQKSSSEEGMSNCSHALIYIYLTVQPETSLFVFVCLFV